MGRWVEGDGEVSGRRWGGWWKEMREGGRRWWRGGQKEMVEGRVGGHEGGVGVGDGMTVAWK